KRGGPVTITHPEMTRFFMTIPEAAKLVIQAGALGRGGEIFVLDMGEQVKVADPARDMILLSGLDPERDVPLQVVGIRPGEKLYEELAHSHEKLEITDHSKIFRIAGNGRVPSGLERRLKGLYQAAIDMEDTRILELLSEIISSYRPKNDSRNGSAIHGRNGTRNGLSAHSVAGAGHPVPKAASS